MESRIGGCFGQEEEAAIHWDLAEAMFALGEVIEARKITFDARQMLPDHLRPAIDHALAAYYVLLTAAAVKWKNWYAVLGVRPFWDVADIRRHYQYLAKMLHPDKNPSAVDAGDFGLVREAWERISRRGPEEYVIIH